jgi:cell volume regulation protein A
MIPKGLGAAVLASLPIQQGIPGGEIIQAVVFSIILCSTFLTTILTFLIDKTWLSNVYEWIFRMMGIKGEPNTTEQTGEEPLEEDREEKVE